MPSATSASATSKTATSKTATSKSGASPLARVARAEALGGSLPPLLVAAERVASTVAQGVHGRRKVGTGETFWQYRPYGETDSAHAVDWRRSARSDSLYVRETEWEASQSVWVWTDHSASMAYRSSKNRMSKGERAELLLLAVSAGLLRGGERLGLLGADRRANGGKSALKRLAMQMLLGREDRSGFPASVDLPAHATGLLFSDFLAPVETWARRFAEFSEQRVRGLAIQVLDPAEEELPFDGHARFQGLEEEGDFIARRVDAIRPDYKRRLLTHREALRSAARAAGWELLIHRTDRSAESALMALYGALSADMR